MIRGCSVWKHRRSVRSYLGRDVWSIYLFITFSTNRLVWFINKQQGNKDQVIKWHFWSFFFQFQKGHRGQKNPENIPRIDLFFFLFFTYFNQVIDYQNSCFFLFIIYLLLSLPTISQLVDLASLDMTISNHVAFKYIWYMYMIWYTW